MFDGMFEDEPDINVEALNDREVNDFISKPHEAKKNCPDPLRWRYEHREQYPYPQ